MGRGEKRPCPHLATCLLAVCFDCQPKSTVGQNLFRTSNLTGSCWPEALLFQSWGSLLVLFGLGLSVVF